ncbi:MAG TPA: lytic murein transglycosylase [Pseudolabrys sp.]|nr:lytic murein transglycosylase [Pseudolabrys sp.]
MLCSRKKTRPYLAVLALIVVAMTAIMPPTRARADSAFTHFLASLWPQAQKRGISRATFDAAIRGLEPDYSLPDLAIPGRPEKPAVQPEFVQTPAHYLREATFRRLADEGRRLKAKYRDTLRAIQQRFGVPGDVVLAIWARETDYGRYPLSHDAIRVLATQAYVGKRKDFFRQQLLDALKMLQDGVPRADMRASWGGALGQTQFLPSDYFKYAVDLDHSGRADIWHSVPDALASAAKQLKARGWQTGEPWAIEVHPPHNVDCTVAEPKVRYPIGDWIDHGYKPAYGRKVGPHVRAIKASLMLPEGVYGPAFLTPKNYYVLKDYNYSDLYVLFVGHLSDLIGGGRPFETAWSKDKQLRSKEVEAMQRRLAALGLYHDKIDGKAGMLTRAALGAYQKKNGLKVDCWPTAAVLAHMRR